MGCRVRDGYGNAESMRLVFPKNYNRRVTGLGIGRRVNTYQLIDRRGCFHYVNAPGIAAAQRILDTLDRR